MRINNYTIERLSEQELLDCSKKILDVMVVYVLAFEYCIENDGLVSYMIILIKLNQETALYHVVIVKK